MSRRDSITVNCPLSTFHCQLYPCDKHQFPFRLQKNSPVSLQQRDRAFIRNKNLAVPLFLPRNAATRQRSDNRPPLYRSGSVRPTGSPVQTGRSEASIQFHPPLPRTTRQLSGGGKETAFSSSTRFLYVTRIIAPLPAPVKRAKSDVLSRSFSRTMPLLPGLRGALEMRKIGIWRAVRTKRLLRQPLLYRNARVAL